MAKQKPNRQTLKVAGAIVEELFGSPGEHADRLALVMRGETFADGHAGWCAGAVVDLIERHLRELPAKRRK